MGVLLLMGPGLTPDTVADLSEKFEEGEIRLRPGAVRITGLSPMAERQLQRRFFGVPDIDVVWLPEDLSIRHVLCLTLDMDSTLIQNECIDDMAALCGKEDNVAAVTREAMEGKLSFDESLRARCDMDSTLIQNECIDDMAALCGKEDNVAAVTREAMEGKLSFDESLRARCAVFAGEAADLPLRALAGIRLTRGALRLIDFCRHWGLETYIVSGGFSTLAEPLARRLGMTGAIANVLVTDNDILTGDVTGPDGGPILNAEGKRRALEALCGRLGCDTQAAIAAGDGANDREMIAVAGVGVAFHAKPILRFSTPYTLDNAGLDGITLLFQEAWQ